MEELVTIILAAGKGTRMKSDLVKVLHPVAGIPMLAYPIRVAQETGSSRIIVVVGHQRGRVEAAFHDDSIVYAHQEEQLGTGHAIAVTEDLLKGYAGDVLILCGDVPLIRAETIDAFMKAHRGAGAAVSVLSVVLDDPFGYGRIIRNKNGDFLKIVEERDAGERQRKVREINSGIYCCDASFLFGALKQIKTDNDQGEYYLPDIIGIAVDEGKHVQAVETADFQEVQGINDRVGLAEAEKVMRRRVLLHHMTEGVTILDPEATYIDGDVVIGRDTVVYPGTHIKGGTKIGTGCIIEAGCAITDAVIGNNVHIKTACVIDECCINDSVRIGPFAHLRPRTVLEKDVSVGNFVEITRSKIGKGTGVNHLTYLGDADVGKKVNIGAGTITCNFDGNRKQQTVIEDNTFIGSNAALVAPVRISRDAVVGAGSTITKDVPEKSLGVARSRQRVYTDVPERHRSKSGK